MKKFQQGDVILQQVSPGSVPKGEKKPASPVLAEGEVTGHAHRLAGEFRSFEVGGGRYVMVQPGGATLTHEEHGPVTLPAGTYRVGIVREFDHFLEESREVRD